MKLKISFLFLSALLVASCSTSKVIAPEKYEKIISKPVEQWTYEDCDNVIAKFTSYDQNGYEEKYVNQNYKGSKVFIKATPLSEEVITAKIRKEAIIRRYNDEQFKNRLKEELEYYTNKTLDLSNGKIILKETMGRFKQDKISFDVLFENISEPREPIEIEYASDGFFLENTQGDFARVNDMFGYYIEDYFVLIDRLKAVITFSVYDDNGKNIFYADSTKKGYKLVFNGFQQEPIIVSWGDPITE